MFTKPKMLNLNIIVKPNKHTYTVHTKLLARMQQTKILKIEQL